MVNKFTHHYVSEQSTFGNSFIDWTIWSVCNCHTLFRTVLTGIFRTNVISCNKMSWDIFKYLVLFTTNFDFIFTAARAYFSSIFRFNDNLFTFDIIRDRITICCTFSRIGCNIPRFGIFYTRNFNRFIKKIEFGLYRIDRVKLLRLFPNICRLSQESSFSRFPFFSSKSSILRRASHSFSASFFIL